MVRSDIIKIKISCIRNIFVLCCFEMFIHFRACSQITVYPIQNFNFGTFYQGNSGGAVNVSAIGTQTASGDIILVNTSTAVSPAIFDVEAPAGTIITLSTPDALLTGSNGGTVSLHISSTDPASPFNTTAAPPNRTRVLMAGTLTIGNPATSPPGTYQGTFSITFNQQ
jgi:hypothetical protein